MLEHSLNIYKHTHTKRCTCQGEDSHWTANCVEMRDRDRTTPKGTLNAVACWNNEVTVWSNKCRCKQYFSTSYPFPFYSLCFVQLSFQASLMSAQKVFEEQPNIQMKPQWQFHFCCNPGSCKGFFWLAETVPGDVTFYTNHGVTLIVFGAFWVYIAVFSYSLRAS